MFLSLAKGQAAARTIRLVLASACLLLPVSQAAGASEPATAEAAPVADESGWIPFELAEGGLPSFEITINGHPLLAFLDTGATDIVIDSGIAAELGIVADASARVGAIGGAVAVTRAKDVNICIGQAEMPRTRVTLFDLAAVNAAGDTQYGAIVGAVALGGDAVEIDFANRRFRIVDAVPAMDGAIDLPMELLGGLPVVTVRSDGQAPLRILLDTGKDGDFELTDGGFDRLVGEDVATTDVATSGLGGLSVARLAVLPDMSFLGYPLREVALEASGEDDSFISRLDVDGIAGTRLLQRFNLVFDFNRGSVRVAPSGVVVPPLIKSTSGLQIIYGETSGDVVHVMKGSPAARTGWEAGDRVCRIDGRPAALVASDPKLRSWSIGTPGRTVLLDMCDGTTRRLTLAEFY